MDFRPTERPAAPGHRGARLPRASSARSNASPELSRRRGTSRARCGAARPSWAGPACSSPASSAAATGPSSTSCSSRRRWAASASPARSSTARWSHDILLGAGSAAQRQRACPTWRAGERVCALAVLEDRRRARARARIALRGEVGGTLTAGSSSSRTRTSPTTSSSPRAGWRRVTLFHARARRGPASPSRPMPSMAGERLFEMTFDARRASAPADVLGAEGGGWDALAPALRLGALAKSAEMVGCRPAHPRARRWSTRRRASSPAGPSAAFQAIQHACADLARGVESARPLVLHAAWKAQEGAAVRRRDSRHGEELRRRRVPRRGAQGAPDLRRHRLLRRASAAPPPQAASSRPASPSATPLTTRRRSPAPSAWQAAEKACAVSGAVAVLQEDAVAMPLGNRIDSVGRGRDGGGERARLVVEEALDGPKVVLDLRATRPGTRVLEQAKREMLDRLARGAAEQRGTTAPTIPRAAGAGRRRGSAAPSPADRSGCAGRVADQAKEPPQREEGLRGSRPETETPRATRTRRTDRARS